MKLIVALFCLLINSITNASDVVARIDEKIITSSDVAKRVHMLSIISPEFQNIPKPQAFSIALDQIINEYIYRKEGQRLKIELDDNEKRKAIEYVETENKLPKGSFIKFVVSKGLDPEHVKQHLETQMLWQKIVYQHIKPKVQITDNEVKKLINDPNVYKFYTVTITGNDTPSNREKLAKIIEKSPKCTVLEKIKESSLETIKQNDHLATYRREIAIPLTTLKIGSISSIINIDNKIAVVALCDKTIDMPKEEFTAIKNRIGQEKMMALANLHLNKAKRMYYIEKY